MANPTDQKRSMLAQIAALSQSNAADTPTVPPQLTPALDAETSAPAPQIGPPALSQRPELTAGQTATIGDQAADAQKPAQSPEDDALYQREMSQFPTLPSTTEMPDKAPPTAPQHQSFLSKLGKFAGGLSGLSSPDSDPTAAKGAAVSNLLGRAGNAIAVAAGTPEQKQIAEEERKTQAELPLRLASMEMLNQYHQGQNANRAQTNDIKSQQNDAAMMRQGFVPDEQRPGQYRSMTEQEILNNPELEQKWNAQMTSTGLKQADIDKVRDMLMGQFPVDATTAALANRPDLAGKSVSMQMYKGMQQVINAKGLKIQDLGPDGMWILDRAGNKFHQVSAVGPSVARAQAFAMFKPVQAIDSTGTARFMTAGEAEKSGATPAGVGATSMGKQAQFNDIHAGIGMMRSAINGLPDGKLSPETIATLTAATRETDPTIAHQLIDTYIGSNNLSPEEQNFVVATQQLNERALSLRNIAGMGNGSDQVRAAIRAALPSAKSGNTGMMKKQLDAVTNLVDNLQTGIVKTNTPNGGGSGVSSAGPIATHRWNPATQKIEALTK